MTKRKTKRSANNIKPLQQGSLDSLCGLYAAINAIRLANGCDERTSKNLSKLLFSEGIKHLAKQGKLKDSVRFGMSPKRQRRLMDNLLSVYESQSGTKLTKHSFKNSILDIQDFLEFELEDGRAVCVNLEGAIDHYTLITAVTPKQFTLFDSDGLKTINRSSISFADAEEGSRYWVARSSVYSIGWDTLE